MKWLNNKPYLHAMLAGFGSIALSIVFFFFIYRFQGLGDAISKFVGILAPFIYGAVIAYILTPACNFFERQLLRLFKGKRRKLARALAVTGSILSLLLVVYLLLWMIIPSLITSIISLVNTLPGQINTLMAWISQFLQNDPELMGNVNTGYEQVSSMVQDWVSDTLMPYIRSMMTNMGGQVVNAVSFVGDLIVGIAAAIYMLASGSRYVRGAQLILYSVVKREWADLIMEEVSYADRCFSGFISGKLLDSTIIGLLCYVLNLIFGVKNPILIAAIIGVTNIIPFFGPFIGAIPCALLVFVDSPLKALWFVLYILALQQFDGNVIGPKILGSTTGLSSFWVLFSILLFGGMWGFVGMVIGVPLFGVIYDIIRKLVLEGLKRNGAEDKLKEYASKYGTTDTDAPHEDYTQKHSHRGVHAKEEPEETPAEKAAEVVENMAARAASAMAGAAAQEAETADAVETTTGVFTETVTESAETAQDDAQPKD